MNRLYRYLFIFLPLVAVVIGCTDKDSFSVSGVIEGNPTMNLRAVYYGNDALQNLITPVRDGKFEFKGSSRQPTIVQLYDNDYRFIGRFYAVNGKKIKCEFDRSNPNKITVSGDPINEEWSAWLTENQALLSKKDADEINRLIEKYVEGHKDNVVSSLLIVTLYDASTYKRASTADSLLTILSPEARPEAIIGSFSMMIHRATDPEALMEVTSLTYRTRKDTVEMFVPENQNVALLAFTDENVTRADSVLPTLRRLSKKGGKRLKIVDFSLVPDTFTWARITRNDSSTWTQAWRPGGVSATGVDKLALPQVPYYIVVDSTGSQLYRGTSIGEAEKIIDKKL